MPRAASGCPGGPCFRNRAVVVAAQEAQAAKEAKAAKEAQEAKEVGSRRLSGAPATPMPHGSVIRGRAQAVDRAAAARHGAARIVSRSDSPRNREGGL